jgi:hypothetical protein
MATLVQAPSQELELERAADNDARIALMIEPQTKASGWLPVPLAPITLAQSKRRKRAQSQ